MWRVGINVYVYMKQEKQVKSYTRRTKSGKTVTVKAHTAKYEAANKKDASKKKGAGKEFESKKNLLGEFSTLPKVFNHMGEQYVPTGKIKTHTEKLDGITYKVATCKAKNKKGKSISLYQYDKKGRKDFGMSKKWDVEFI